MSKEYRGWVKRHQDDAWSLALYLLNDRSEAEDVTQEAFMELWRHRDSVPADKIRPWLMKVTRNACFDRLRKRRAETDLDGLESDGQTQPANYAMQTEVGEKLKQAIGQLAEPARSLVVLRDVLQYSYDEVAGATGLNLSQVKVYLHRARKRLRAQLEEFRP